jgi:hypothetical protein
MPRARIRDDYPALSLGRYGRSSLDLSASSVPVALDDDRVTTGNGIGMDGSVIIIDPTVPGSGNVFPTVTVRERFQIGHDDDGNPQWSWADTIKDASAIYWVDRTEASDKGGITLEKADVTLLYPISKPQILETATVLTSDGKRWDVDKIARFPDRIIITISRVSDDGA